MTQCLYSADQGDWYWYYEYAFRIGVVGDGATMDVINPVATTVYTIPIALKNGETPLMKKKTRYNVGNYLKQYKSKSKNGYEEMEIIFQGDVVDRGWFPLLTDQIVNTGAEAPYTHTHDSSSASGKSAPPRTIRLIHVLKNEVALQNRVKLYTGCIVTKYVESCGINGVVTGSWTVLAANEVDGNIPTTIPSYPSVETFSFGDGVVLTYAKGATTYEAVLQNYEFTYETNKKFIKGITATHAIGAKNPSERDVMLQLVVLPYATAIIDDLDESPESALDKNASIKTSRSASDYFQISMAKCLFQFDEITWDENLAVTINIELNPKESGYKLQLIEVNSLAATRY
jgi:hypothetical protein